MAGSSSGKDELLCDSWSTGVVAGHSAVWILPCLCQHMLWSPDTAKERHWGSAGTKCQAV